MVLSLKEFVRGLVSRRPAVAILSWRYEPSVSLFIEALAVALRRWRTLRVEHLSASGLTGEAFANHLELVLARHDAITTILVVSGIEPLAPAAGTILNGLREQLGALRATIVLVRENRWRDFAVACPDFVDWAGMNMGELESLTPLSKGQILRSIRDFEQRHSISSDEFIKLWRAGQTESIADAWAWKELLGIVGDLR